MGNTKFHYKLEDDAILFIGAIDQFADFTHISSLLKTFKGICFLDLKDVSMVNSFGIRSWVNFVHSLEKSVVIKNCAVILVEQFAMVPETISDNIFIASLFAEYSCAVCMKEFGIKFNIDKKFEEQLKMGLPEVICKDCNEIAEFLGDDDYFHFLTTLKIRGEDSLSIASRQERKPFQCAIKIMDLNSQKLLDEGKSRDLSIGGMCIKVSKPISTSTQIIIQFTFPNSETTFRTFAIIKWLKSDQKRHLVGVKFTNPDRSLTHAIRKYINDFYS